MKPAATELLLAEVAPLDVSAASGLVVLDDGVYVVADDETFLAIYGLDGSPRARVTLFPGELPEAHAERKRQKPDLEALTALPDGRLLALGSGSTERRRRGALIDPARGHEVRPFALAELYVALYPALPELNVEGAAVIDDRLVLLSRGNGRARLNARVDLDLARVLAGLERAGAIPASALIGVTEIALPELAGVPLGFTDAAAHPRAGLLFSAAAEDSADTYADGSYTGAALGVLRGDRAELLHVVQPACKLEGIACAKLGGASTTLLLVADPDDLSVRATLLRAELAL